ncbi:30S ribosomal protein S15, partial [Nanoarchaeota archaeon]
MARMYSRKKGKSKSNKPLQPEKPSWLRYSEKEVELLVTKLAKEGKTAAKIGLVLRDSYGIPSVKLVTGKSITKIVSEKKLSPQFPEDFMALLKKAVLERKHIGDNKKDMTALRGLQLTESKILRLSKYYKKTSKLAPDWKYKPEEIALIIA